MPARSAAICAEPAASASRAPPPLRTPGRSCTRWPFLVLAVGLFVLNLPVYGFSLGYGLAAVPVSLLLAAPVAIAWSRPMIGWALALVPLIILLPVHGLIFPETLAPFPWLANQLAAHLPVIYLLAVSAPRSICFPAVARDHRPPGCPRSRRASATASTSSRRAR